MDFSWAESFPDIHRICTLFQLSEISHPEAFSYKPLPGYIQEGPQCGLVALAMLQGNPSKQTIDNIYNIAKQRNYTFNGEIFSAADMTELLKTIIPWCKAELYCGDLNSARIREFLLTGGYILVPYDTEKDNSPGLLKGHKAHWAIISGGVQTDDNFYVIARHGKAKNVAIWNLNDLARSNAQLLEFSPDRKLHNVDYKLPDGGIAGNLGLNGKSVMVTL